MTLLGTLFPLICWFVYNFGVRFIETRRPSLSVIMSIQRRRWVANIAKRESPMDAILSGNLMGSVSFLASTSVLLILAVFTAFGQIEAIQSSMAAVALGPLYTVSDMQLHLVAMLVIFVLSFFAYTLALRQFNHFCILVGAMDHAGGISEAEIDAIAQLNSLAARNFNNGLRAYYFAVATVAWFASPWLSVVVSLGTVFFLIHREFFSSAHRIAASATVLAERRKEQVSE